MCVLNGRSEIGDIKEKKVMLGGNVVDNLMEKLAEKISAQDIIKANAQAEAAEAERLKQEAEQFRIQLQELKDSEKEHREFLTKKMEDNETRIHDVGVQVYRNVQAVVEKGQEKESEEFKELNRRLEAIQVGLETKNSAVVPLVVITMLVALADLVINILRILGIV